MNKEYNLAVAFLQFKKAYTALVAASEALPDRDVSTGYPFYLLDFEAIKDAVSSWCSIQANQLLRELPDKVDNPVCTECEFFRIGVGADGLCKAAALKDCSIYPLIVFSKEQVMPFMAKHAAAISDSSSELDVYVLYTRKLEEIYDRQADGKKDQPADTTNAQTEL